ncbi:hypothetical protein AAY473_009165 [Plecturocebus cupreus]
MGKTALSGPFSAPPTHSHRAQSWKERLTPGKNETEPGPNPAWFPKSRARSPGGEKEELHLSAFPTFLIHPKDPLDSQAQGRLDRKSHESRVEMGFHHVGQAGLELLTLGDLPALASQSAGITGIANGRHKFNIRRLQRVNCGDKNPYRKVRSTFPMMLAKDTIWERRPPFSSPRKAAEVQSVGHRSAISKTTQCLETLGILRKTRSLPSESHTVNWT